MDTEFSICEKPESISYEEIAEIVNNSFGSVRKNGIRFGVNHLTGQELEQIIKSNHGKCFVALENGRPTGTLSVVHKKYHSWFCKGDAFRLRFMAVLPEYSGRHIASSLVSHCIDYCRKETAKLITVSTPANNAPAIHLYSKQSFSKIRYWWNKNHYVIDFAFWPNGNKPSSLLCTVHYYCDFGKTKLRRLLKR